MRRSLYRAELKMLFRLALPLAAAQAGGQLMGLVDVAVLGRLGARELAASSVGNAIFFAVSILGMGIALGIDPLVSQAVGAHDEPRARRALWQGIWLTLVVSAVLTLALLAGAAAIPLVGSPELTHPARVFLLIRTAGLAPALLFFVLRSYLQAHAVTRPMLVSMVIANVVNFGGDILLVFGGQGLPRWCGVLRRIPPLGVAGAALSTVACTILQLAIVAWSIRFVHGPSRVDRRWKSADVLRALRIGLPIGLHMGAEIGVFALVALVAAHLGTLQVAAHQLAIGLASFTFTIALGVSAAGTVRVGRAIGARDPVRTRIAGHVAFVGAIAVMGTSAAAFALFPRAIAHLVTNQEEIIRAAEPLLMIAAVFQLFDGLQAVGAGVLRGAGDTKFTMWANVAGHWMVGLPIALLFGLVLKHGVIGLWWGLCVGLIVVAVLLVLRFEWLSARPIEPIEVQVPL